MADVAGHQGNKLTIRIYQGSAAATRPAGTTAYDGLAGTVDLRHMAGTLQRSPMVKKESVANGDSLISYAETANLPNGVRIGASFCKSAE